MRSFEIARKIVDGKPVKYETDRCQTDVYEPAYPNAQLPLYKTCNSAGADFFCAEEVTIPSICKALATFSGIDNLDLSDKDKFISYFRPTLVHTGIKASMEPEEVLILSNRSSNPSLGLVLANGIGVIDADYYNNVKNDGEIMFAFYNFMPYDITLKVGDTLGQGIFSTFKYPEKGLRILNETRNGGFGSTNKN